MRRRWNLSLWLGALLVPAALAVYLLVLVPHPAARDRPWILLPIFAVALALVARGVVRAWRAPQLWRGRLFGSIVGVLATALAGFLAFGILVAARDLPASAGAPKVGERAPDFTLPDQNGKLISLASLLGAGAGGDAAVGANGALLIFYRGTW
jgi:hypothetical protein